MFKHVEDGVPVRFVKTSEQAYANNQTQEHLEWLAQPFLMVDGAATSRLGVQHLKDVEMRKLVNNFLKNLDVACWNANGTQVFQKRFHFESEIK